MVLHINNINYYHFLLLKLNILFLFLNQIHFLKYFKTKFFRAMLGVKKVTHHCPPTVWKMIPLQDFTSQSDIDWSKSIPEIDKQLYDKYSLSPEEIEFIETHVKEME